MARNTARPLVAPPHHLALGPAHAGFHSPPRTGIALSVGGLFLLTWFLLALSGGARLLGDLHRLSRLEARPVPLILLGLVALTWSFFQHTLSGIRHLIMDIGAGFELGPTRPWPISP
jgi:succinate dehydrogenase / fumarate reductase cytochrome b subunit